MSRTDWRSFVHHDRASCCNASSAFYCPACKPPRSTAERVDCSVNSSDSFGTLSTNGPTSQFKPGGNVARQRNGFALNVHAAARIEISPVRIEPPEISAVFSRRQFMLVRFARVFDLRDSRAVGVAVGVSGVERMAMHVVIGIEDDGDDLLFPQAIVDFEIVARVLNHFRLRDFRLVILGMAVVILDHREHLGQRNSRDENRPHPVMNQSARRGRMARRIRGLQPRRNHFAALQPGIGLAAARFRQTIDPEKHAARRQFALHPAFGEAHVLIESLSGFRP